MEQVQNQNFQIQSVKVKGKSVSTGIILLAVGVAAAFAVFFGWGLIDYISNYSKGEAPPVDTSYPKLTADINEKVAVALNAENVQDPASLASNFNNQMSGGNNSVIAENIKLSIPSSPNTGSETPRLPPLSVKAKTFPTETVIPVNPNGNQNATVAFNNEPQNSAVDRLNERNNQIRRGNQVSSLPEIYDIDDVTPLGVVGDQKKREVLFYSPVTKQTFSAPLGTRFRNGSLEDAAEDGNTVEGVRFRRDDTGSLETRIWAKNAQGKTADSSEQPVLAKEPVLNPTNKPKQARRQ